MTVETNANKTRSDLTTRAPAGAIESQDAMGRTSISDDVVSKIAGIATREVEGVHQLVTTGVAGSIAGLAQRISRADTRGQGVAVEVGQKEAAVDLAIQVDYGVNIRQVCERVKRSVATRIEEMTGLRVKEVNVLVADLYFAEDEGAAEPRRVE